MRLVGAPDYYRHTSLPLVFLPVFDAWCILLSMKRTVWTIALILGISCGIYAQDDQKPFCPPISITGPAGFVKEGDIAYYTANIGDVGKNYDLRFIWSVSSGSIAKGQGTLRVGVVQNERQQTVTLNVEGLPSECPNNVSESEIVDRAPQAEKLAQFAPTALSEELLRKVAMAGQDNPTSQLFVFVPSSDEIQPIAARLYGAIPDYRVDFERLTFLENRTKNSLIQVWLVPLGATPPNKCENCELPDVGKPIKDCPTVSVLGPPGITTDGDNLTFRAAFESAPPKGIRYSWIISAGTIIGGQGTDNILIKTPGDHKTTNITASLTATDASRKCSSTFSETAGVGWIVGDPYDEYGVLSLFDEMARVQGGAMLLPKDPGYLMVIIKEFSVYRLADRQRIEALTDFLIKDLHFPQAKFRFIVKRTGRTQTTIWFVPPGAKMPG
jgi:hypothetical protein